MFSAHLQLAPIESQWSNVSTPHSWLHGAYGIPWSKNTNCNFKPFLNWRFLMTMISSNFQHFCCGFVSKVHFLTKICMHYKVYMDRNIRWSGVLWMSALCIEDTQSTTWPGEQLSVDRDMSHNSNVVSTTNKWYHISLIFYFSGVQTQFCTQKVRSVIGGSHSGSTRDQVSFGVTSYLWVTSA